MNPTDRLLDTRPLRASAAYRYLWVGSTVGAFGHQVAFVALLLQVWQLTGSPVWVGAIGLVQALPMVAGSLVGGLLADTVDRRKLIMFASLGGAVTASLLAAQAAAGLASVPVILALVAAQATGSSISSPARKALIPRLLPRRQVAAGIALNHVSFQAAMLAGPAVAGVIAARWGVAACYLVAAVSAAIAFATATRLPAVPPPSRTSAGGDAATGMVRAVLAGWGFIARRRLLRGALLTDLAVTLLAMPVALFPVVTDSRFDGDPAVLGLMLSAVAVGGIAAGLASGAITRYRQPGRIMLISAAAWGVALAGFGLATPVWLALGCLVLAGAADTVTVIARGTIVQLATPDSRRGRVNAAEHLVGGAGPQLGNFRAGLVADLTTPAVALVAGGLLCALAVAAIGARNRDLRNFDTAPWCALRS